MEIKLLNEPILQFSRGEHICPRAGIYNFDVSDIDSVRPDSIALGFVGLSESINKVVNWIKHCRSHVDGKKSTLPNLFTNFPGFNKNLAFKSEIVYDDSYIRKINNSTFEDLKKTANDVDDLILKSIDLYLSEIKFLAKNKNPDVILCVLDESFTKMVFGTKITEIDDDSSEDEDTLEIEINFRRLLKARSMWTCNYLVDKKWELH